MLLVIAVSLAVAVPTRLVANLASGQTRLVLLNLLFVLVPLAAALAVGQRARRARGRAHTHLVLTAVAITCWGLGQAYWMFAEVLLQRAQPFPSWADAGFLLLYPPLIVAFLLIPSSVHHPATRLRGLCDAIGVSSTLLLLMWSVPLVSVLDLSEGAGVVEATVGLAYPSFDGLLLSVTLMLLIGSRPSWRAGLGLYAVAVGMLLVADSGFAYLVARDQYATGSWFDLGWMIGFALLAVAARRIPVSEEGELAAVVEHGWATTAVPTGAFVLAMLLALLNVTDGQFARHPLLSALMSLVFLALIGRSVLARAEGEAYASQLARATKQLSTVTTSHEIALEAANMVTWTWRAEDCTWRLGVGAELRLGAPQSALEGPLDDLLQAVAPEDRQGLAAALAAVRVSSPVYDVEFGLTTEMGTAHLRTRGAARYSYGGQLLELVGVLFDVSETRRFRLAQARRDTNAAALGALGARLPNARSIEEGYDDALGTLALLVEADACTVWRHDEQVASWPQPTASVPASRAGTAGTREFEVRAGGRTWGTLSVRSSKGELTAEEASLAGAVASMIGLSVERGEAQSALWRGARYDALTGLPNRVLLGEHLAAQLHHSRSRLVTLAYLDLDDFKRVNDRFGHPVGDELLRIVATRLQASLRPGDLVARLGGDEFALVMNGLDSPEAAREVAERALRALAVEADLGPTKVTPRAALGIATTNESCRDATVLLRNADLAMYVAKREGSRTAVLFESRFHDDATSEGLLADELRGALERGEFVVYYQPVVDLATGALCGAEALLRWLRPGRGVQAPADFLPALNSLGLLGRISEFVLAEACAWAGAYVSSHVPARFSVAVNVTPADVTSVGFGDLVTSTLAATGLEPHRLTLEIVESGVLADVATAAEGLKALRARGVRVAIDDFGTGYASMAQLKSLPVDIVKIDKGFVDGLATQLEDSALAAAVVSMAHALGLDVVAEGVETVKQREALVALGCEMGQGYLFGRPVPAAPLDFGLDAGSVGAVAVPAPRPAEPAPRTRLLTVVVADDLEDDRRILARFLSRSGRFTVIGEAEDGAAAVQLVRDLRPDVALLDVSMPVLDGFAALARIQRESPRTEVVMLSGYVCDTTVRDALAGGARGCLAKGPSDISAMLLALLEGEEVGSVR